VNLKDKIDLKEIMETIQTTRNFYSVLIWPRRSRGSKKRIVLKDGSEFHVTFLEYCHIRRLLLLGYRVCQANNKFKVTGRKCELLVPPNLIGVLGDWVEIDFINRIDQLGKDTFNIKGKDFELVGSSNICSVLCEAASGVLNCNCRGKVVLDIGGYQGESAVLFSKMGAEKIIIYEPFTGHHEFIKQNIRLNNVTAEIHEEGIGSHDGTRIIRYSVADLGFGILSKGPNEVEIKIRNVSDVLEESHADIAKIDCEGAEECLVDVPAEILRKIGFYLIETHADKIKEAIVRKFMDSGFRLVRETTLGVWNFQGQILQMSMIGFQKTT
jgi:FkbM family methyltransferase